jgi:hypothetical protein
MMEHPCPLYTTTHSLLTEALSGLFATVTAMTLMTLIYGLILERGCISTS